MLVLNPLHTHIFSHMIKHTQRSVSVAKPLWWTLNLKSEGSAWNKAAFLFFSRFLAFAARQITGAERLLCRLLYKLTQFSATTRHYTVNQQQLTASTTAEPSASRWSRAPEWDLKKSSNLQMTQNKRLFVKKTTILPPFRDSLYKLKLLYFFHEKGIWKVPVSFSWSGWIHFLHLEMCEGLIVELAGCSPQSSWAWACAHYHNQRATKNRAKCKRCLQVDNRRAPWKVSACSKGVFPCCCCLPDKCSWGHINKVWCWLEVCGEWCLRIRSLPALMDHLLHNKDKFSFTGGPVSAWTLSGCSRLMDGACLPPTPPGSHPTGQQQSHSLNQWADMMETARIQGQAQTHRLMVAICDIQQAA